MKEGLTTELNYQRVNTIISYIIDFLSQMFCVLRKMLPVSLEPPFLNAPSLTFILARVTGQVPLVVHELFIIPEQLILHSGFSRFRSIFSFLCCILWTIVSFYPFSFEHCIICYEQDSTVSIYLNKYGGCLLL